MYKNTPIPDNKNNAEATANQNSLDSLFNGGSHAINAKLSFNSIFVILSLYNQLYKLFKGLGYC